MRAPSASGRPPPFSPAGEGRAGPFGGRSGTFQRVPSKRRFLRAGGVLVWCWVLGFYPLASLSAAPRPERNWREGSEGKGAGGGGPRLISVLSPVLPSHTHTHLSQPQELSDRHRGADMNRYGAPRRNPSQPPPAFDWQQQPFPQRGGNFTPSPVPSQERRLCPAGCGGAAPGTGRGRAAVPSCVCPHHHPGPGGGVPAVGSARRAASGVCEERTAEVAP